MTENTKKRTWRHGAALALLGLGAAGTAGSCTADPGTAECEEHLTCDVINPDGTNNGECEGRCVPTGYGDFHGPFFVKIGPPSLTGDPPAACWRDLPRVAPNEKWHGFAAPPEPPACPPCPCSEPTCELPDGVTTSSQRMCSDDPAASTRRLDAPPGWDGSCISPATVPAGQLASYEVPAATVRPCAPLEPLRPLSDEPSKDKTVVESWLSEVIMCDPPPPEPFVDCKEDGARCLVDHKGAADSWQVCIAKTIDLDGVEASCPTPSSSPPGGLVSRGVWYSEPHVFYGSVQGTLECSPCSCNEVAPSTCEAFVSVYEDAACGSVVDTTLVTEDEGRCHSLPGATGIGSLSARWRENAPGRCEPGARTVVGEVKKENPWLFCCIPWENR